ncbi:MAG: hypothetical protein ABW049_08735, partial [Spongiibacteraceae bacterium]
AEALNQRLSGETLYSDGWGNDYTWLSLLFDAAGLVPRFRLQPLRLLLSEEQERQWHDVHAALGRELVLERHRASSDARLIQQTWLRTLTGGSLPGSVELANARPGYRG